jgi:exonuclease III
MEGTKDEGGGGYRLQAVVHGTATNKNGVGILINKSLKSRVVDVKRCGDRIILVKLVFWDLVLNVISAYAPQVGHNENTKRDFREGLEAKEVRRGVDMFKKPNGGHRRRRRWRISASVCGTRGQRQTKNGVGILINKSLKSGVVDVKRCGTELSWSLSAYMPRK